MSMDALKNESGQDVLPGDQMGPDPVDGMVYNTEEYNRLKAAAPTQGQEGNTEKVETTKTNPETVVSNQEKPNGVDYNSILKEKTGGKFEKWEDLEAKLNETHEVKFENEESKKVFELLKEGKVDDVSDILYKHRILSGVDKLNPADKIKLRMQWDNPEWNQDDVEDEFNEKYAVEKVDENASEEAKAKAERKLERKISTDARAAQDYLTGLKKDLVFPELSKPDTTISDQENELLELNKQFVQGIDKDIPNFRELDLSINDEDVQFTHKFTVEENDKAELSNKSKDYWAYFQSRYYKDGQYDTKKLLEDIYWNENRSKMLKSAVTKALNQGKVETVKGIANADKTRSDQSGIDQKADANRKALEDFILA